MLHLDKVEIYVSSEHSPYINLAIEEYLFEKVNENELILFVWQNEGSVIIGRNQNPYFECNLDYVKKNNINVVRRNTGGGAVYHDLGNLNYSVIQNGEAIAREVICKNIVDVINSFGIGAKKDGRNDITVDGKKISGMAFLNRGRRSLYHGCILVATDIDKMTKSLNVSAEKFSGKKIDSVRARVVNLSELIETLEVDDLKKAIIAKFTKISPVYVYKNFIDVVNTDKLKIILEKYESTTWSWGIRQEMTVTISNNFEWGNILLALKVDKNRITEVMINSDSLEVVTFEKLQKVLIGSNFNKSNIISHIRQITGDEKILNCICAMIEREKQIK